jgi:thiamine pyrophosphokinase
MINKVKIFTGPNNYDIKNVYSKEDREYIVGVDSGLKYLIDQGIHIDLAVGDFDSIPETYIPLIKSTSEMVLSLPKAKKMTDLAFALDYVYTHLRFEQVEVYGGIGKRTDHFLANVNLMKKYNISFRDDANFIFVL